MIEIDDSGSPEQFAADAIRLAFNAMGLIQAKDDGDQWMLADIQRSLSEQFVALTNIRSVI